MHGVIGLDYNFGGGASRTEEWTVDTGAKRPNARASACSAHHRGIDQRPRPPPVAWDTTAFIYFIEEHFRFLQVVEPVFAAVTGGRLHAVTSGVTLLEPGVATRETPPTASTLLEAVYDTVVAGVRTVLTPRPAAACAKASSTRSRGNRAVTSALTSSAFMMASARRKLVPRP
jgi:hypothetical protein